MRKKVAELCGETTFDDLGLGTSAGTGNLEEVLVEPGQRVAADGAAVAPVGDGVVVVEASWMDIS
jgi:hypothetical protein